MAMSLTKDAYSLGIARIQRDASVGLEKLNALCR